jgi:hypothetical protein
MQYQTSASGVPIQKQTVKVTDLHDTQVQQSFRTVSHQELKKDKLNNLSNGAL